MIEKLTKFSGLSTPPGPARLPPATNSITLQAGQTSLTALRRLRQANDPPKRKIGVLTHGFAPHTASWISNDS